jgi:hypothetical protein
MVVFPNGVLFAGVQSELSGGYDVLSHEMMFCRAKPPQNYNNEFFPSPKKP